MVHPVILAVRSTGYDLPSRSVLDRLELTSEAPSLLMPVLHSVILGTVSTGCSSTFSRAAILVLTRQLKVYLLVVPNPNHHLQSYPEAPEACLCIRK